MVKELMTLDLPSILVLDAEEEVDHGELMVLELHPLNHVRFVVTCMKVHIVRTCCNIVLIVFFNFSSFSATLVNLPEVDS